MAARARASRDPGAIPGASRRARRTDARGLPAPGDRTVVASVGACTLGISDLDGRGEATLAADDALAVAFAGALDNAGELAARFGTDPERAATPAEVVLAAFGAIGTRAPNLLRGTYACVVTDGVRLWASATT